MVVFIAGGDAGFIPKTEEQIIVLATENSLVPAELLNRYVELHLLKEEQVKNPAAIGICIGMLAQRAKPGDKTRILSGSMDVVNAFQDLCISIPDKESGKSCTITVTAEYTGQKPVSRKTVRKNNPATKKAGILVNLPETDMSKKVRFLIEKGIQEKHAAKVVEAVEESSDAVIGLDIKLKTKLAGIASIEEIEKIKNTVSQGSVYKRLKKQEDK